MHKQARNMLSFDGRGINLTSKHSQDGYNQRIATLADPNNPQQQALGAVFAHAPEVLEEFRFYVERARRMHERKKEQPCSSQEEMERREKFERRLARQEALIKASEGFHMPVRSVANPQGVKRPVRLGA